MDLFALPDVFLHQLMKTVTIKDRTRLRQKNTLRSFEQLVANTHAGFFQRATIIPSNGHPRGMISISIYIGSELHRAVIPSDELDLFIAHWNRLFRSLTVRDFEYYLAHGAFDLHSIRKFTAKMKIGTIYSAASDNAQFYSERAEWKVCEFSAVRLMADFPGNKHAMDLRYMPEHDLLLSLPPLSKLKLSPSGLLPAELLMKLIYAHKDLQLQNAAMTPADWLKMLKDLSADARKRTIQLEMRCPIITNCLRRCGISEYSKDGDFSEEFELLQANFNRMQLRYRKCRIDIGNLDWTSTCRMSELHMTNWK